MATQLSHLWNVILVRGILAIVFGILAFVWPAITLAALVLLFGVFALADGLFAVIVALANRAGHQRWWTLIGGLAGAVIGILTFLWPGLTALTLIYFVAAWALIIGAFEIAIAIDLRKVIAHGWWLVITGILSILFGILVAASPGAGALSLIWLIATYAVIFGVMLVIYSVQLRRSTAVLKGLAPH